MPNRGVVGMYSTLRFAAVGLLLSLLILATTGCQLLRIFNPKRTPANIRNPGEIKLPQSFSSVWYRPQERSLSLKAYSHSGELVVGTNGIEFKAGGVFAR